MVCQKATKVFMRILSVNKIYILSSVVQFAKEAFVDWQPQ